MKTSAYGLALLLLAVPAHAQNTGDPRWSRWIGCWELVTENSREGAPGPSGARRGQRTPAPADDTRPQVCVQTIENGGARFTTRVGTQTPIVQTVVTDGAGHPINEDGCTGTQRAEWSADGLRLYARAELTCKDDRGVRQVSGLALFGPDGRWVDVQAVDVAGRESFRVRKYRRANGAAELPRDSGTPLTLEHVKEALTKISPRAVEAALVETRASFDLTSKHLLDLDAADVPDSVVDLIVALSYPDRFVIERTASVDRAMSPIIDDPFAVGWAFGAPVWYDWYAPYSPYYYSPFGYPYYPIYFPGGGWVIDGGGGGGGGGGGNLPQQPSGRGRAVDGHGYTRVQPRGAEPTPLPSGSTASSSGGGGGSSTSSSSGSSSGGGVSSQGFSSGGGDGGGRTAQPR